MSAFSEGVSRYGAVAVGLAIGTAAKYGVALSDGTTVTWRGLLADVLMLGFLGVIAVLAADLLALQSLNAKVFVGAVAALLSARLITLVRDRMLSRAAAEIDRLVGVAKAADAVEVPAGSGKPDEIAAQVAPKDTAAAIGAALRKAHPASKKLPPDLQEPLDRLHEQD